MKAVHSPCLRTYLCSSTPLGNSVSQAGTDAEKTTLLHLLAGAYEFRGTISAAVRFDYFPYPVPDNNLETQEILINASSGAPLWAIRRELSLLGMPENTLFRPFKILSGGERAKALLAALFLRENCFPLIDEPTNHLDLEGRRRVGEYLRGKEGFLLVSHDRSFLDSCVDHMISLNRNSIDIQKGNFSSWHQNKECRDQFELKENEKFQRDISCLREAAGRTAPGRSGLRGKNLGPRVPG
jgi:lincosamide and streptogramin A transport system ATP-binding/permease protein